MRVFILQEPRLISCFSLLMLNYLNRHSPLDIHEEFLPSLIRDFGSHSRRKANEYVLSKYNVFPNIKVVKIICYCNCNVWNGSVIMERRTMTSLHFC